MSGPVFVVGAVAWFVRHQLVHVCVQLLLARGSESLVALGRDGDVMNLSHVSRLSQRVAGL